MEKSEKDKMLYKLKIEWPKWYKCLIRHYWNFNIFLRILLSFSSSPPPPPPDADILLTNPAYIVCVYKERKKFRSAGTFDSVGTTELQDAGKAGLITVQGKISAVLGTALVCKFFINLLKQQCLCSWSLKYFLLSLMNCAGAYLFITFFPEQAEKLLQFAPTS